MHYCPQPGPIGHPTHLPYARITEGLHHYLVYSQHDPLPHHSAAVAKALQAKTSLRLDNVQVDLFGLWEQGVPGQAYRAAFACTQEDAQRIFCITKLSTEPNYHGPITFRPSLLPTCSTPRYTDTDISELPT